MAARAKSKEREGVESRAANIGAIECTSLEWAIAVRILYSSHATERLSSSRSDSLILCEQLQAKAARLGYRNSTRVIAF